MIPRCMTVRVSTLGDAELGESFWTSVVGRHAVEQVRW